MLGVLSNCPKISARWSPGAGIHAASQQTMLDSHISVLGGKLCNIFHAALSNWMTLSIESSALCKAASIGLLGWNFGCGR